MSPAVKEGGPVCRHKRGPGTEQETRTSRNETLATDIAIAFSTQVRKLRAEANCRHTGSAASWGAAC
eukprot:2537068-Alexandrium_andersonii.AAC.1